VQDLVLEKVIFVKTSEVGSQLSLVNIPLPEVEDEEIENLIEFD
jgi:hydrogenase/urease accessory protein HupE